MREGRPLDLLLLAFNVAWRGGGTFYRALEVARHLARRGHRVTLIATHPQARRGWTWERVDGVELGLSPALLPRPVRYGGWDPWTVLSRLHRLRDRPFDLVHTFETRPVNALPARRLQGRGALWVADWADLFGSGGFVEDRPLGLRLLLRRPEDRFERQVRLEADGHTAINGALLAELEGMGVPPERRLLLRQGVDLERIRPLDPREARRRFGLEGAALVVGFLGQTFRWERALLQEAFARLRRRLPGARLFLIGRQHPPLPPAEGVIQSGVLPSEAIPWALAACDLFWLPLEDTRRNRLRWPSKAAEYLAAGRPVIASPTGELADLFGDGRAGRLAADPEAFVAHTLELGRRADLREAMGRAARRLAEARFGWAEIVAGLEAFYRRLWKEGGR